MKPPAELYTASLRPYHRIADPHYLFHDKTVDVTSCGRLCLFRKTINLSTCLAGRARRNQRGRLRNLARQLDGLRSLGYIDLEEKTPQPLEDPRANICVSPLGFQPGRVHDDAVALQQFSFGENIERPLEHRLMCLHVYEPAGARDRGVVWNGPSG
jgi:hypothetical protein